MRRGATTMATAAAVVVLGARLAAALPTGPLTLQWRACFPPPGLDVDVEAAEGQAIAPAPDGSGVFVVGTIDDDATGSSDILVVKYRADGTLDPAFGDGRGFATHHRREANENGDLMDLDLEARAVAVDPAGNVYVAAVVLGDALLGSLDALTVKFRPTGAVAWEDAYNKNVGTAESPDHGDEELHAIVVDEQRGEVDVVGTVQGDGTQAGNVLVLRYPLATTTPARDRRRKELDLDGEDSGVAAVLGTDGALYLASVRPGQLATGGYEFVTTPPCPGARYYPAHGGYARGVSWVAVEGADAVLAKWVPGANAPAWSIRYGYSDASFLRTLWHAAEFEVGPPPDFEVVFDCTGYVVRTFTPVTYTVHGSDDVPVGLTVDGAGNPVLKLRTFDGAPGTVVARFARQSGALLPVGDGATRGARLPAASTTAGLVVDDTGDAFVTSAAGRLLVSRAAADGRVSTIYDGAGQVPSDGTLALAGDALYVTDDVCATRLLPLPTPVAPSDLRAQSVRDPVTNTLSIALTWQDNSDNERGFALERSVDGVTFVVVLDLDRDTTTAAQTALSPTTRYTYRVRAWNTAGTSAYSNRVTAGVEATTGTPPAAPVALGATASPGVVQLTWQDASNDESFFSIERSQLTEPFAVVGTAPADATAFSDRTVAAGVAYTYRVTAVRVAPDGLLASAPALVAVETPVPVEDEPSIAAMHRALDVAPPAEISASAVRALHRLLAAIERTLATAATLEQAGNAAAAGRRREQAAARLTGRTRATGWRDGPLRVRMARFVRRDLLTPVLEGSLRATADRVAADLRGQ